MQTIKRHTIILITILLWSCVSVFAGEVRTTHFLKDSYANGERTVKSSGENAAMFVNAEFAGGATNTAKFSLYVSPYMVVNADRFTKHYYAGSQRIASKIDAGEFNNLYDASKACVTAGQKDYAERMNLITQSRNDYYAALGIPPQFRSDSVGFLPK